MLIASGGFSEGVTPQPRDVPGSIHQMHQGCRGVGCQISFCYDREFVWDLCVVSMKEA